MQGKILCVDDDANVLSSYQRGLRQQFEITVANGGAKGLQVIDGEGPFAVVVSDMRMPEMDGIEFLSRVREKSPDTVRIMLTANTDLMTAIEAVNKGSVFRFLTKPCAMDDLAGALTAGLRQHELLMTEREMLEKTLNGSLKVMTDILSIIEPASFGRVKALHANVRALSKSLPMPELWTIELAAMLSQIGFAAIPPETVLRARRNMSLTEVEKRTLESVPELGHKMLAQIPRLEPVAEIVLYQAKRYDGGGVPANDRSGENIPFGARVLKILADLIQLESQGVARGSALLRMRGRQGWYDPNILQAVCAHSGQ